MANPYIDHYGTSFGFVLSETRPAGYKKSDMIMAGIYTHGHSFRDYGLYPAEKPVIETPEIQTSEIEIPARDGILDATEALDGMVHYYNRTGTFRFSQVGGRKKWDSTYSMLKNNLHGKRMPIIIDEELDGFYEGRLTVNEPEYNSKTGVAIFEIEANLDPFKYGFTESNDDWLWDPFSFVTGVIREYGETQITTSGSITLYGSRMPVVPDIYVISGSLSVSWAGHSAVALDTGSNFEKTPDLVLTDEAPITLNFTGTGKVKVIYPTGVL